MGKRESDMEIKFEHITKAYKSKTALDNVNICLSEGVNALLGPNGAGKSTMMNILADLIRPTEGQVLFNGEPTQKMGDSFRGILGYLPQDPGFYGQFSGYDLMRYFAELKNVKNAKDRIHELLTFVNLIDERKRLYKEYSGGMKRRLGIAVSMLNDPDILILDEPTAGLDPNERIRFRNIISRIGRRKIIVLATHIVSDVETIADQVVLLKNGKVLYCGNASQAVDTVRGKVWMVPSTIADAEAIAEENPCATVCKTAEGVYLRIVSETKPAKTAMPAAPTMEDMYMSWFHETS